MIPSRGTKNPHAAQRSQIKKKNFFLISEHFINSDLLKTCWELQSCVLGIAAGSGRERDIPLRLERPVDDLYIIDNLMCSFVLTLIILTN